MSRPPLPSGSVTSCSSPLRRRCNLPAPCRPSIRCSLRRTSPSSSRIGCPECIGRWWHSPSSSGRPSRPSPGSCKRRRSNPDLRKTSRTRSPKASCICRLPSSCRPTARARTRRETASIRASGGASSCRVGTVSARQRQCTFPPARVNFPVAEPLACARTPSVLDNLRVRGCALPPRAIAAYGIAVSAAPVNLVQLGGLRARVWCRPAQQVTIVQPTGGSLRCQNGSTSSHFRRSSCVDTGGGAARSAFRM